jgi:hypothetical protein
MSMEFILPSLYIVEIIELSYVGAIYEWLEQLVHLEEDWFIGRFHQQVKKSRQNS